MDRIFSKPRDGKRMPLRICTCAAYVKPSAVGDVPVHAFKPLAILGRDTPQDLEIINLWS
jgi:hypothetical protein